MGISSSSIAKPTIVKPRTTSTIDRLGAISHHHACSVSAPWLNASSMSVPHDCDFGSPRPRKDSCDSDRIAIAMVRIVFAKMIGIRFGVMCLITTWASLAPSARDRSM